MSLTLDVINEQTALDITDELKERLEQLLAIAAETEGLAEGEVALTFVDDETIRELNRQYRGIDRSTDVLSFPLLEKGDDEPEIVYDADPDADEGLPIPVSLGDIVISVPRALAQAEQYGHSAEREIGFLFVHGLLHLLGYDHRNEDEERIMFEKQERILQKAGLRR